MRIAALEKAINNLQQPTIEGVQKPSYLIQQYKYMSTKLSLKKQNDMLQEELDSTKCFLEKQNQRVEESIAEDLTSKLRRGEKNLDSCTKPMSKYCKKRKNKGWNSNHYMLIYRIKFHQLLLQKCFWKRKQTPYKVKFHH